MLNRITCVSAMLVISLFLSASVQSATIEGTVYLKTNYKPAAKVPWRLWKYDNRKSPPRGELVRDGITNAKGEFKLPNLANIPYYMEAEYVPKTKTSEKGTAAGNPSKGWKLYVRP
jgi:hypothetical protein